MSNPDKVKSVRYNTYLKQAFEMLIYIIKKAKDDSTEILSIKAYQGNDWMTYDFIILLRQKYQLLKTKSNNPGNWNIEN